ncbi:MAG: NUDIX domain-containing protein [Chloroflexi bacterium]|nr:NUDIX domain-containing protein [Chloroflexota bacterium]
MQPPMHIVAACALISNADGEILLINSPKRGWEIPGGQIEVGESLINGLQREIHEEAGVRANIGLLTGVYSNIKVPTKVIFTFLGTYISGDLTPSSESSEVVWVKRDQVLALVTHPALRDRISDTLSFAGHVVYRVYTTDPYTHISLQNI